MPPDTLAQVGIQTFTGLPSRLVSSLLAIFYENLGKYWSYIYDTYFDDMRIRA